MRRFFPFAALVLCGCGPRTVDLAPKTRTGAEEVARTFFTSILNADWQAAYETLDNASRSWCSLQQFAARGQRHLKRMGFAPTEVNLAVTETGDNASANAVFRAGTKQFRDGAALRRTKFGWRVELSRNFGA